MNQVGDKVYLVISPIPSGSAIYSYVWDFWDGESTATIQPFVAKVLNIGGQPGTDELHYSCRPVSLDGQSITLYGTLYANNPPTLLRAAVSANNLEFPYTTDLEIFAIDQDGDTLNFSWYNGDTFLSNGVSVSAGVADGTWKGNNTQIIAPYPAIKNSYQFQVTGSTVLRCYVYDNRQGTVFLDFNLRGSTPGDPLLTTVAGLNDITFDSTAPASVRVGAGQAVDLTVYTSPLSDYTTTFVWGFHGSLGWMMPPTYENGVTTVLDNGNLANTVHRDLSAEVVTSGTEKIVLAQVEVIAVHNISGQTLRARADYALTLIGNSAPSAVTVLRKVNGVPVTNTGPVSIGDAIEFSAEGTDANSDLLTYKWEIFQPFAPATVYYWGPKIVYMTTSYSPGQFVTGLLTVTDWLGDSMSVALPVTAVS